MYPLAGSVLELHAAGTHHQVVSAGAGPSWPDFASPAVASLGAIPPRPPVAARAAGEAAGLDGSENRMDFNLPVPDSAATSLTH